MYAVIKTGGKQYRVSEGQQLQVEPAAPTRTPSSSSRRSSWSTATPWSPADALGKASVTAKVVGASKGPKITGFTYKNKSNQRKRWGHRQRYDTIEITGIKKG